jgi:L-fucose isomerase
MARIGVLTFSDGRSYAHDPQIAELEEFQRRLQRALADLGHELVLGELVHSNQTARDQAERLARAGVEATIFHYAVWAFPQFSVVASRFPLGPLLLLGQINPAKPGMVAVLAAAGALEQLGLLPTRVFGQISEPAVLARVDAWARAAHASRALRGQTYGLIGGRSIGINTAVSNTDQWAKQFGVDVEHIDQWEVVRRASAVDPERVKRGRIWLEHQVRKVHYDGVQLTPAKLERQVAAYHALRELAAEKGLDFLGIKGQPELTEHYATMDVPEAFLNDPYDWEGPHPPLICSTEADMDAALTMQILHLLSGSPVLFADVRHYLGENIFDLVNSGQHPTFFAARSQDPAVNLAEVELHPQGFYFPAGGASVFHVAAPGPVTLARLSRLDGRYRMHLLRAELLRLEPAREAEVIAEVQPNWPHAFAKLEASAEVFLQSFPSNHVHAVPGDWVAALLQVCRNLGVEPVPLGAAAGELGYA